jgi:hypothetical protein
MRTVEEHKKGTRGRKLANIRYQVEKGKPRNDIVNEYLRKAAALKRHLKHDEYDSSHFNYLHPKKK